MNYDKNSFVATMTVTCYSWALSSGDHLFTCGAIYRSPHIFAVYVRFYKKINRQNKNLQYNLFAKCSEKHFVGRIGCSDDNKFPYAIFFLMKCFSEVFSFKKFVN